MFSQKCSGTFGMLSASHCFFIVLFCLWAEGSKPTHPPAWSEICFVFLFWKTAFESWSVAAGAFFCEKTVFWSWSVAAGAFFMKKMRFWSWNVAAGAFFLWKNCVLVLERCRRRLFLWKNCVLVLECCRRRFFLMKKECRPPTLMKIVLKKLFFEKTKHFSLKKFEMHPPTHPYVRGKNKTKTNVDISNRLLGNSIRTQII